VERVTTKLEFLRGVQKLAGWSGSFLMVDRNNAGRLGAGFIIVCFQHRLFTSHFLWPTRKAKQKDVGAQGEGEHAEQKTHTLGRSMETITMQTLMGLARIGALQSPALDTLSYHTSLQLSPLSTLPSAGRTQRWNSMECLAQVGC